MEDFEVLLGAYQLVVVVLHPFLGVQQLLFQILDNFLEFQLLIKDQLVVILLALQLTVKSIDSGARSLRVTLILDIFPLDFL